MRLYAGEEGGQRLSVAGGIREGGDMTSLEYYIEQIEQFISALTDDIESGEGTIVTQTKLAVYREVLEHLEEIDLAISALSQPQPDIEAIRQEIKDCIYWPVVTDAQDIQNYAYEHCVYIVDKHIQKGDSE